MTAATPAIQLRPLEALLPYARNSRTHSPGQISEIAASIDEFGMVGGIVVRNGVIAKGHGTLAGIRKLYVSGKLLYPAPGAAGGATPYPSGTVPVIDVSGWTESQFRAYVIADNKIAENAGWDFEALGLELLDLQADGYNLSLTGFDDDDLTDFMEAVTGPGGGKTDPDDAPPTPEVPVSVLGDVWCVGDHRVMCGSSLEASAWNVLMGTEDADVVFTDPPYGVSIGAKNDSIAKAQGRKNKTGGILNDELQGNDLYNFLLPMFRCVSDRMKPGASIYVYHADSEGIAFRTAFRDAGFKIRGCLIWKKNTFSMGRSDHQWIHEPALFGWREGAAHTWLGGRKQSTFFDLGDDSPFRQLPDGRWQITVGEQVFTVSGDATVESAPGSLYFEPKPARSELHPTQKPVALVARHLKNSARRGATVLDAFGGSGSTAIAAHQLGMKSRLMELDPKYVDVIAIRLSDFTGLPITHAVTGEIFPRNGGARLASNNIAVNSADDGEPF